MKPRVILNIAMSLDGRVSPEGEDAQLSNKLDQERLKQLRGDVDAVIVDAGGAETLETLEINEDTGKPKLVVIDTKGEFSPADNVKKIKPLVAVPTKVSPGRIKELKKESEVMVIGHYSVNLKELMTKLYRRGIRKALLEGGGHLAERMFNENLIDELFVLVNPVLIGNGGTPFIEKISAKKGTEFSLRGITQYGDHVLLHYVLS